MKVGPSYSALGLGLRSAARVAGQDAARWAKSGAGRDGPQHSGRVFVAEKVHQPPTRRGCNGGAGEPTLEGLAHVLRRSFCCSQTPPSRACGCTFASRSRAAEDEPSGTVSAAQAKRNKLTGCRSLAREELWLFCTAKFISLSRSGSGEGELDR